MNTLGTLQYRSAAAETAFQFAGRYTDNGRTTVRTAERHLTFRHLSQQILDFLIGQIVMGLDRGMTGGTGHRFKVDRPGPAGFGQIGNDILQRPADIALGKDMRHSVDYRGITAE